MDPRERQLLAQLKGVTDADLLSGRSNEAMAAASEARFRARQRDLEAHRARMEPVHSSVISVVAGSPQGRATLEAFRRGVERVDRPVVGPPSAVPAPSEPVVRAGSLHLIDVPPFLPHTWQQSEGSYNLAPPVADGASGTMTLDVSTGFMDGSTTVNCWAAVGQIYSVPEEIGASGGLLRFSAAPSFTWQAFWASELWRLSTGDLWIGLVVNQFDSAGRYAGTPASFRVVLFSWHDSNFVDNGSDSGDSTGYGLPPALVFLTPGFVYECLVWMGADASGYVDTTTLGLNTAQMRVSVTSLILDAYPF